MKKISLSFFLILMINSCSSNSGTTQVQKNERALYQKFLAKKSYDELNKEIP